MDEQEYQQYMEDIERLARHYIDDKSPYDILEQLRDEEGERVPGCYYTRPSPTYG